MRWYFLRLKMLAGLFFKVVAIISNLILREQKHKQLNLYISYQVCQDSYKIFIIAEDGRSGSFKIGNDSFPAALLDMPCVLESYKTYDDNVLIKTADIGQVWCS